MRTTLSVGGAISSCEKVVYCRVFRIQDVRCGRRSRKVVHFDRLKPCLSTVCFPQEHTTPKKQTVKQTTAPEYTDQPAPHLPWSELQFFDEGEDLEQTDPGVDTNPDAGNVEQDEAEVGVLPSNQAVNEIPALPMSSPVPQDK